MSGAQGGGHGVTLAARLARALKGEDAFTLDEFIQRFWIAADPAARDRLFEAFRAHHVGALVHAVACPETILVDTRDNFMARELFVSGAYQIDTVLEAHRLLRRERGEGATDTLFDIGANMGVICVPAVARGLYRRAIAIEPTPAVARLLRANIALNGLEERIAVHQTALSDAEGEIAFELSDDNTGDNRIAVESRDNRFREHTRRRIVTPMRRFDDLPVAFDPASTLAWIDVQGHEGFVLAGAEKLVGPRVPLALEIWPYGLDRAGSYDRLMQALARYERFCVLGRDGVFAPIAELNALYDTLRGGTDHADILVL